MTNAVLNILISRRILISIEEGKAKKKMDYVMTRDIVNNLIMGYSMAGVSNRDMISTVGRNRFRLRKSMTKNNMYVVLDDLSLILGEEEEHNECMDGEMKNPVCELKVYLWYRLYKLEFSLMEQVIDVSSTSQNNFLSLEFMNASEAAVVFKELESAASDLKVKCCSVINRMKW